MTEVGARTHDPRLFLIPASEDPAGPEVVGNKAAGLMRMAGAGLPVPAGFVLSTTVCANYYGAGGHLADDEIALIEQGVQYVEAAAGLRFGASRRPLLVAVRSGAAASMPGMLETVLNVGLCDATVPGLLRSTGDPMFVWDSYRRLVESYAEVVEGIPPAPFSEVLDRALRREEAPSVRELDVATLREVTGNFLDVYRSAAGHPFPQDPMDQLVGAVDAVLRSWNSKRAIEYRRLEQLTSLTGTAITVQQMVFGNIGMASGSGVAFTRDPATGENRLYIDFVLNAQGEDVVAGRHVTTDPDRPIAAVPGLAHQIQQVRRTLEATFRDVQDFEFTVEEGSLWLLQSRAAKRTEWAALQIACDLVEEGLIDSRTATHRLCEQGIGDEGLDRIMRVRLVSDRGAQPIGRAIAANTGVASGCVALGVDTAVRLARDGASVILVREHAATDDIAALEVCRGLLTATGARTSHAAVVARQLGLVCLVNCLGLAIDPESRSLRIGACDLKEGDVITIDGEHGTIYAGALELIEERPTDLIARVRSWAEARQGDS